MLLLLDVVVAAAAAAALLSVPAFADAAAAAAAAPAAAAARLVPVEDAVVGLAELGDGAGEHGPHARVIRPLVVLQLADVVEVGEEDLGQALAQLGGGGGHLHFADALVALLLVGALDALPGEAAAGEVGKDLKETEALNSTGDDEIAGTVR